MTARTLAPRSNEYDFSGLPPEATSSVGLWEFLKQVFRLRHG
jgi:hypothetical protein